MRYQRAVDNGVEPFCTQHLEILMRGGWHPGDVCRSLSASRFKFHSLPPQRAAGCRSDEAMNRPYIRVRPSEHNEVLAYLKFLLLPDQFKFTNPTLCDLYTDSVGYRVQRPVFMNLVMKLYVSLKRWRIVGS